MNMQRTWMAVVVASVALATSAYAGGSWSDKTDYRRSNGTSLKVTDPDGFKVTVAMPDGNDKADTVPAIFALPDQDTYVKVTVFAPDGTQWSKKIEIRANQQASVAVTFKADAAQPARTGARRFTGKLYNLASGCGRNYKRQIKMEVLRSGDGTVEQTQQLDDNTHINVELSGGKYDVRVFAWTGSQWDHVLTGTANVTKDGWQIGFGCKRGTKTPTVDSAE